MFCFFKQKTAYDMRISDWSSDGALPISGNRNDEAHRGVVAAAGSSHSEHSGHGGHDHGAMVADYRRRFWLVLVLTPPVLLLSPMIQHWLGIAETLAFPGDRYVLFVSSEERRVGKECVCTFRSRCSPY